jgi:hypothetical protein
VIIGLVFSIMYWLRLNTLMTWFDRTDSVHTGLSILSVFFLLLLLYVVRVSEQVAAPSRRAGEGIAVALIGIAAGGAWWRARRTGLVRSDLTTEERLSIQIEAFAEPLSALVTLPFARWPGISRGSPIYPLLRSFEDAAGKTGNLYDDNV